MSNPKMTFLLLFYILLSFLDLQHPPKQILLKLISRLILQLF